MPDHAAHMRRALELAHRGWGMVRPNPLVGAVVVRGAEVVGEGWHGMHGGPHAEVEALRAAGESARGATLYVTLEPCAHEGKTPPCTDAIIAAGIVEVVFATPDPNPEAGGGADRLRQAGVRVTGGVDSSAARLLDPAFFRRYEHDLPFVALKLALSLDGRIAARPGTRTDITGAEARQQTYHLRAGYDAVLVGIETVLVDDPVLTVRNAAVRVAPARVVLDSEARLPHGSRLIESLDDAPLIVMCGEDAPTDRTTALQQAGARVLHVRRSERGLDLTHALHALRDAGVHAVFVEGGARVATALVEARLVQRMHLFVGPVFLGVSGVPAFSLEHVPPQDWQCSAVHRFGSDVLITLDIAADET